MNTDKILELAAYNESDLYSERRWSFDEEELIAFAQSVLEEEQEQSSYMTLRTQNTITFVLLTVMFVSVSTVIISCFAIVAERDNKAIQAGLQQCVVGTRNLWQKECGK